LLEQVSASVGRLDLVADRVSERHFADLAGIGRAFRRPIAERGAEAMHGEIVAAHAPEKLQHRHVAERRALLASAEQVSPGWLRLNHLDCLRREWHAMLLARFHAAGRDGPDRLLQVDLLLRLAADDFARAGRGQNQKLKRACSAPSLAAQVFHEGRQLIVRKRGVMLARFTVERRRQELVQVAAPAGGVLATAVAPDPGVVQDALDAPPDPASGLGLLRPDLLKDAKDQGGVHVLYRQLTDDRPGVGVERGLPLLGVLLVSPARAVGGDVLPGALGEADRAGLLELFLSPVALARRERVSTAHELPAGVRGLRPSLGKAHIALRSQAHFVRSCVPRVPEDPALARRRAYLQIQPGAIAVIARLLRLFDRLR